LDAGIRKTAATPVVGPAIALPDLMVANQYHVAVHDLRAVLGAGALTP